MYIGEVNVAQDELDAFLLVAEDLRVKGLTHSKSRSDVSISKESDRDGFTVVNKAVEQVPEAKPQFFKRKSLPIYHQRQQDNGYSNEQQHGVVALNESYTDDSYSYELYDSVGVTTDNFADESLYMTSIEAKMVKVSKGWKCLDCDSEYTRKDYLLSHIQGNHVNFPGYSCNICGKTSKTWIALSKHRSRSHRST